jgi:hypothetical protein
MVLAFLTVTSCGRSSSDARLAETASRGSTAEERDAAVAWLEEAARSEHQIALKPPAATPPSAVRWTRRGRARRPRRTGAPRDGSATPTAVSPDRPAPASLTQPELMREPERMIPLDALQRQQQRILHRSALIDYVLAAEQQRGQTFTLGDALAELLADITEAARTIGTLLQTATGRP